jgi:NAD(P)-dependent dehydrogenase (short-subunit alcohol dehydrogenase family)
MKIVVITGSTRGIGYGLADSFLDRGSSVMISGRTPAAVNEAVANLADKFGDEHLAGHSCNVREFAELEGLWTAAVDKFGKVDIWINNAGINHKLMKPWQLPSDEVKDIIETNLLGVMYGSMVAVDRMIEQGAGAIYNMEGMGSTGRKMEGMTVYGTTKYGLRYFTDSLVMETKNTPIIIGAIRPGMVMTDMLLKERFEDRPEDLERTKRVFNILADRVDTVAPWLVDRMLANEKTGIEISWLTTRKIAGRFLMAPFRDRDVFQES